MKVANISFYCKISPEPFFFTLNVVNLTRSEKAGKSKLFDCF